MDGGAQPQWTTVLPVLFELIRQIALGPVGTVAPAGILFQDTFRQRHLILRDLEEAATGLIVTLHEVVGERILTGNTLIRDMVAHLILHLLLDITPTAQVVPAQRLEAEFITTLLLQVLQTVGDVWQSGTLTDSIEAALSVPADWYSQPP